MRSQRKRTIEEEILLTPKKSRRKNLKIEDLSPSNQPINENINIIKPGELIESFTTSISHKECCPENGNFMYHRGIEPGYPKGYYCCPNVCMSSEEQLTMKFITPYYVIYGAYGPLGTLSEEESAKIKKKITDFGGESALDIEVAGFSCFSDEISLKKIPGTFPPKFLPNLQTWRLTVSLSSPLSTHRSITPRQLNWNEDIAVSDMILQESPPSPTPSDLDGRRTPPPSRSMQFGHSFSSSSHSHSQPRPLTPTTNFTDRPVNCFCSSPHLFLSSRSILSRV